MNLENRASFPNWPAHRSLCWYVPPRESNCHILHSALASYFGNPLIPSNFLLISAMRACCCSCHVLKTTGNTYSLWCRLKVLRLILSTPIMFSIRSVCEARHPEKNIAPDSIKFTGGMFLCSWGWLVHVRADMPHSRHTFTVIHVPRLWGTRPSQWPGQVGHGMLNSSMSCSWKSIYVSGAELDDMSTEEVGIDSFSASSILMLLGKYSSSDNMEESASSGSGVEVVKGVSTEASTISGVGSVAWTPEYCIL